MKLKLFNTLTIISVFTFLILQFTSLTQAQTSQPQPLQATQPQVQPQEISKTKIEMLSRPDCAHCKAQKEFLAQLATTRDDFELTIYNIEEDANLKLWEQLTELEGISKVTPITLIGTTVIEGFGSSDTTGVKIESLLDHYQSLETITLPEFISAGGSKEVIKEDGACEEEGCVVEENSLLVNIPFLGAKDVSTYSLPTMAVILGFIDGFNPCAMWVLVTFLIVLAQLGDKKKMWIFAGVFIAAEAIMYTLILTVWLTTWDFIGLDKFVTPIVGLVAIGGGIFFMYEFWSQFKNPVDEACKVTNVEQKRKITQKIKDLTSQKFTFVTFLAIIALAFSVNVIEFACSIGIPQAFTKIIQINQLDLPTNIFLIFLYIIFYMIDDVIVFGLALYSFDKIGLTAQYTKWTNLLGGILMAILGILLIFKPELLMF